MKISLLSAWNSDSGAAIHAELIGREWIRTGHQLSVFSFIKSDFHGKNILREDEKYVTRCFGTPKTNFFDARPILSTKMDVLIVEDLGMLPKKSLAKIFPTIRKMAKTINIIHDNKSSSDPYFYKFKWDKVIFFNKQYSEIFKNIYPKSKTEIIPYPSGLWESGEKKEARRKLKLPEGIKIFFVFGWWARYLIPLFPVFRKIRKRYPFILLVSSRDKKAKVKYLSLREEGIEVDFREEIISEDKLYLYLHASDAFIFGDKKREGALIPSTATYGMGAGCLIIAPRSNFFEMFNREVLKYSTSKEFEENIIEVINKGKRYKETLRAQKFFVMKNNLKVVAKKYIRLFEKLTKRRGK